MNTSTHHMANRWTFFSVALAARYFGLNGTSLDGMGAQGILNLPQYQQLKQQYLNDERFPSFSLSNQLHDFHLRVYTAVGMIGNHGDDVNRTRALPNIVTLGLAPVTRGSSVIIGLAAHPISFIIQNETLRAKSPVYRIIGEVNTDPLNSPVSISTQLAAVLVGVQLAGPGGFPSEAARAAIALRVKDFLTDRLGQQVTEQSTKDGARLVAEDGTELFVFNDGSAVVSLTTGNVTTGQSFGANGIFLNTFTQIDHGDGRHTHETVNSGGVTIVTSSDPSLTTPIVEQIYSDPTKTVLLAHSIQSATGTINRVVDSLDPTYAFSVDGYLLKFSVYGDYSEATVVAGQYAGSNISVELVSETSPDLREISFGEVDVPTISPDSAYTIVRSFDGRTSTVSISSQAFQTEAGVIEGWRRVEIVAIGNRQVSETARSQYMDASGNSVSSIDTQRFDETDGALLERRLVEVTAVGAQVLVERISEFGPQNNFLRSQVTTNTSTSTQIETYNSLNVLTHKKIVIQLTWNTQSLVEENGGGQVLKVTTRQTFWDDSGPSYLDEVVDKISGARKLVGIALDPVTGAIVEQRETILISEEQANQLRLQDELYSGIAGFLNAVRTKDKLGVLLGGAKMASDFARVNGDDTTAFNGVLDNFSSTVGVLGALRGLRSDDALTQVNSAVNLLTNANRIYSNLTPRGEGFLSSQANTLLKQFGAVLAVAGLLNLDEMLENGQLGSAAASVIGAVNAVAAAPGVAGSGSALASFIPLTGPQMVVLAIGALVLDALLGEDPPPPPPIGEARFIRLANGELGYELLNTANLGAEILTAKMDALLLKLNEQLNDANTGNTDPDLALALVSSRMPKVTISSWPSLEGNGETNFFFILEQAHPQTGAKLHNGIARQDLVDHYAETLVLSEAIVPQWQVNHLADRFGTDEANWKTEGQYLASLSTIEQQRSTYNQALDAANEALEAAQENHLTYGGWHDTGEITGNVEAGQAASASAISAAQAAVDAATAALTEFESLHPQDPQLAAHIVDPAITDPQARQAAIEGAARQWLNVIAVDLGGDGIQKIALPGTVKQDLHSLQTDGVTRFDADNDGFREATEWIAPSDAMLGIDRDGNGLIDTASELFNGVSTVFHQRGLASLKYYDSNNDNKIDSNDPVYKLLRLWIDLNRDGSAGQMEIYDLEMRHPGIDMNALRARLDAAGQAALDALDDSVVEYIDLTTGQLHMADGTVTQASDIALQAQTKGIAVVVDDATQNISVLHEDGLRENYVTLVEDMSVLLELQNENISTARRAELEALALKYGLNKDSADFFSVVKSLRTGGENIGASGMAIYIGDSDIWTDANLRTRLEQMRFSFHSALTAGGADVFGTARLGSAVWADASTDTPAFNDYWAPNHTVTAGEVTSDTVTAAPPPPPRPEQWVLQENVYTLDYVVHGAQLGGLVTQQAVLVSAPDNPEAPPQTVQLFTASGSLAGVLTQATLQGQEDEQFGFGFAQLEQEARTLIPGSTPFTTVRLLGARAATHGYVEVDDATGRIRFIPDANYYGNDAGFTYAVMDDQNRVLERTIKFNLSEVNDAPTLLGETVQANEDVPLLLDAATLLANDSDLEGDTLTIIGIGRVGMGRAQLLENGQIRYTPPADLYGVTDTIEYIVQDSRGASAVGIVKITLSAVNDAPTVVSEVIRNAKEDTNLRIDPALLLANDYDPDFNAQAGAAPLRITAVGNASHGQVFIDATGHLIFVPEEDFNGTATFEYTVTDDTGLSTTGHAEVEVGAVNDGPLAFGERIDSQEDEKLIIDPGLLLANDQDVDIQRGEVQRLMVVAVDQAMNGIVSLENGHVVFTPTENYSGAASFRYTVSDGAGGFSQAIANIDIAAVNDAPTMVNHAFQGAEDTPLKITVAQLLAGNTDAEDGATGLSLVEAVNPVGGTLSRDGDTFTFTPSANFNGTARFDYTVQDAQGAQSTATVTVGVNNVNDAPVFLAGSQINKSGEEDQEVRIAVSALKQMFVDVDGDAFSLDTANLVAVNSGDTVRYDATKQEIVFKAKANANGMREIEVRVVDVHGAHSSYQRLGINIKPLNDAPVVNSLWFNMLEDGGHNNPDLQAWTYISHANLLSGSSDADLDTLNIVGATNGRTADGRAVSIVNDAANGRVGVLAPLNYFGSLTFDFSVSDGRGAVVTQKAYGNVTAVNDLPRGAPTLLQMGNLYGDAYLMDLWDVEDGSNVTMTIERYPLQSGVTQASTLVYVINIESPFDNVYDVVSAAHNHFVLHNVFIGATTQAESVTFRLTDSQGGVGFASVNFWSRGYDPVVIDLGGDGLEFLGVNESTVTVDRDGNGTNERVAWIKGSEGILAWDHNDDGVINRFDEIEFWPHVNPQDPARTDLQSLARPEFDTNQDGKFDNTDAKWSEFRLWRDVNENGVSDAGDDLQTLDDAGIKALHLSANVLNRRYGSDVLVRGYTRVEMVDGRMLQAGDVQLGIEDPELSQGGTTPTEAQQQGQLITQEQAEALASQQQQANAAALRAGTPNFSGGLRDQKVLTGQAYQYVLPESLFPALGAGTEYTVTLASGQPLPVWLSFDAATRTLSGTPTTGQMGDWTIKVIGTAPDSTTSAGIMQLTVAQTNQAPVEYGYIPLQFAEEDQAFSLDIAPNFFIDRDVGDSLRFSATLINGEPLPSWLQFDAQNLRFVGTPTASDVAFIEIVMTASDEANASVQSRFKLIVNAVNDAPYLATPVPNQSATDDVAWTYTVPAGTFTDPDKGDTLTYSAMLTNGNALPSWLSFDGLTRTFSGTPHDSAIGSLGIKVIATDTHGIAVSTSFSVAVADANDAPTVLTALAAQSAFEDSVFTFTVPSGTFADPDPGDTLTYSVTLANGEELPSWLGFDSSTQTFNGVPTHADAGTLELEVVAVDSGGLSASSGFTLTIGSTNGTPGLPTSGVTLTGSGTLQGTAYADTLYANGPGTTLIGGAGNDSLVSLYGGAVWGHTFNGGAGDDVLTGSYARDLYLFNRGDGHDQITDDVNSYGGASRYYSPLDPEYVDRLVFGAGIGSGDVELEQSGNNLVLTINDNGGSVTVNRWFESVHTQIENIEFADGTIWMPSDVQARVHGQAIGVTLTGSGTLTGTAYNDTLNAQGKGVHLIGGAGEDTLISLAGGTNWDQTFEGGSGNDNIIGSYARDLYLFNRGDGQDVISDTVWSYPNAAAANWFAAHPEDPEYHDKLKFGTGIDADQVWLMQVGNDLEVSIIGTGDRITVDDWYSGPACQIEIIELASGEQLLGSAVQNLVQAMAAFSPPAAGQTTLSAAYQSSLGGVIAANWT